MILPPGIFWLGFTSYPSISFWVPMMSGIPFGLASTLVFVSFFVVVVWRGPLKEWHYPDWSDTNTD